MQRTLKRNHSKVFKKKEQSNYNLRNSSELLYHIGKQFVCFVLGYHLCPLGSLFLDIIYFFGLSGFYFILYHFLFFCFIYLFVYLCINSFLVEFNQQFKIDTFAVLMQCASNSITHLVINSAFKSNRFNSCRALLKIFSK